MAGPLRLRLFLVRPGRPELPRVCAKQARKSFYWNPGERAAITLALSLSADRLLIDD